MNPIVGQSKVRPILLVVDPPDPETLSTRKLILESQKYNVLTAFTGPEAQEIAQRCLSMRLCCTSAYKMEIPPAWLRN
jgi:hypothetical protein